MKEIMCNICGKCVNSNDSINVDSISLGPIMATVQTPLCKECHTNLSKAIEKIVKGMVDIKANRPKGE